MVNKKDLSRVLLFLILVVYLAACASTATRESTGEYIDDAVITTKVKTLLAEDDFIKSFKISVETDRGIVQLSGTVDSQATVEKAEKIAAGVSGVKSVKNKLVVR